MPSKVILKVKKGEQQGKEYVYDKKEQLLIGRQEDCAIVLTDKTVSRYHCMLEITPPDVTVRDFGSLNGTFLNGEKIGQREREAVMEDAQKEYHEEFDLHDGDVLGLGRHCEIAMHALAAKRCAECAEELAAEPAEGTDSAAKTRPDDEPRLYYNKNGQQICESCHKKFQAEKRKAELAALEQERVRKEKEEAELQKKARAEQEKLEKQRAQAERQQREAEEKAAALARKLKEASDKASREDAERKRKEAEDAAAALKKAEEQKRLELEARRKAEEERRRREEEAKKRLEAEKKRLEALKKQNGPVQKKCAGCGTLFTPKSAGNNLCPKCIADRGKLLEAILMQALKGAINMPGKDTGPAALKGFRKVKQLGEGGMGEVWLVEEEAKKKRYALKTMRPQVAADRLAKETFLREALLGEALDHRNVIKVYKTGAESGVFYILMEFCGGGSVDRYIAASGGKLPLDVATYIILQVLDGLEYAHHADVQVKCGPGMQNAKGIVHRDLKPANIFLADSNRYPQAKVADFGLAKAFETAGLSNHTRTGTSAGTPEFQPRQQIKDFRFSKPEVDVWAAAASYYSMLTGCIPKEYKKRRGQVRRHVYGESCADPPAQPANTRTDRGGDRQSAGRDARYRVFIGEIV